MKMVIKWIKSHLQIVIAAVVALVATTAFALGFLDDTAKKDMAKGSQVYSSVRSVQAVNGEKIAAAEANLRKNIEQYEQSMKALSERSVRKPMMEGIFPEILDPASTYEFKDRHAVMKRRLLAMLVYGPGGSDAEEVFGDQPSAEDISQTAAKLKTLEEQERTAESLGAAGGAGAGGGFGGPGAGMVRPTNAFNRPGGGADRSRADLPPEERLKVDAPFLASVERARSIWCYATEASLDGRANLEKPDEEMMWYAQMALWIQDDVISSLSNLNKKVADKIIAAGGEPWVGNLPVKHLREFIVGDYVAPASGPGSKSSGSGADPLIPPGESSGVFTNQGGSSEVDVIQFGIELVVELDKLPAVIDAISGAGFYTALLVNYELQPPNTEMVGYLYGSAPVVLVQMQYEGCFIRSNYEFMPEKVKTNIAAGTAGPSAPIQRSTGSSSGGYPGPSIFGGQQHGATGRTKPKVRTGGGGS